MLKVGLSEVDITPPPGVVMSGHWNVRHAASIHGPLFARVMIITMRGSIAALAGLCLLVCCTIASAVEVRRVEPPPAPEQLVLDDINRVATIDDVTALLPALSEPPERDLPVMLWTSGAPDPAGRDSLEVERLLQERGLCVPPNIGVADEAALDSMAEIIRFRREQGWAAPVLCQSWGQVFFRPERAPAHDPPASQDTKSFPCIARYEQPLLAERERVEQKLDAMVERGMVPDLFLLDWEIWYRAVWESDGSGLAGALEQALACPVCREKLPPEHLRSPADLMRGLEIIRGEIMRRAFVEPVRERFPDAHIGNYFSVAHVRSDEPLTESWRIVGWHGSGSDFSQPRAYGNYWRYHRNAELVGWNVFWKCLYEFTQPARNLVGDEYQIPWSTRILTYEPEEPFEARGIEVWAWPRDSYREYQRHVLLRGARGLCVFQPNREREGNLLMYLAELRDVAGPFAEMRRFAHILREGRPLNLEDPPGEAYSTEGAVIWSGMATEEEALVRTVSFTGDTEQVTIEVFGEQVTLQAPPGGATWLLTR